MEISGRGEAGSSLYDFYANRVAPEFWQDCCATKPAWVLHAHTDGSRGSFEKLLKAILQKPESAGLNRWRFIASDLTAPISARPKTLKLKLTNVLNQPGGQIRKAERREGRREFLSDGVQPERSDSVAPRPGESRSISHCHWRRRLRQIITTELTATFQGQRGRHAEPCGGGARKTTSTKTHRHAGMATLGDLEGVIPQTGAQRVGDQCDREGLPPFKNWGQQSASGAVTAWMAYDERFFYFAARVPSMEGLPAL